MDPTSINHKKISDLSDISTKMIGLHNPTINQWVPNMPRFKLLSLIRSRRILVFALHNIHMALVQAAARRTS